MNDNFDSIFYFATKSKADLRSVCDAVQLKYQLPDFTFDCESPDDEYGFSKNEKIGFNITKTEYYDEISNWMKTAPTNVNFQISVTFYNGNGKNYSIPEINVFLNEVTKSNVLKYYEW